MFRILFTATIFLTLVCFSYEGMSHDDPITVASNETYHLATHSDTGDHSHIYGITVWAPLIPDGDPVPVGWKTRKRHYIASEHSHDKDGYTDKHSHLRQVGDHTHSDFPAKTPENKGESTPEGWVDSEHTHTGTHTRVPENLRVTVTHTHPHDPNGEHSHPGENVADIRERTLAQTDYWHSHDGYVRHSHPGASRDSHASLDHSNLEKSVVPSDLDLTEEDEEDEEEDDGYRLIGPHSHDGFISHTHLLHKDRSHDGIPHLHTPKIGEEVVQPTNTRQPADPEPERSVDTQEPENSETESSVDDTTASTSTETTTDTTETNESVVQRQVEKTRPTVEGSVDTRQPVNPGQDTPAGDTTTPTPTDVKPNAAETDEPAAQQQVPKAEVVHPTFPLRITSVEERQDPRRLIVTIRNDGRQHYRLHTPFRLELLQYDGQTVGVANTRHTQGSLYLRGGQETVLALLHRNQFNELDDREADAMIHFPYLSIKQRRYYDSDRIALKHEGRLVSEYPEPVVGEAVPEFPLKITSVEEKQSPRRLMVTIENYGNQTYRLLHTPFRLEMLQHDGQTIVVASTRYTKGSAYLRGREETVLALLYKNQFNELDDRGVGLMMHFPYFSRKNKGYLDSDRIALKYEDRLISEYPESDPNEVVSDFPLTITSVEAKKDPWRLQVTIRNDGRQTYDLDAPFSLELQQRDGQAVVVANMRHTAAVLYARLTSGPGRLKGVAETTFALLPKNHFRKVNLEEVSFMIHGRWRGFFADDRLVLKYNDEVISEYPEPVPGEPMPDFLLKITSVEEKQDPSRLQITIKNDGRQAYKLDAPFKLEQQRDGKTIVVANTQYRSGSGQLRGGTETVFALLPKKFFRIVPPDEVSFMIHGLQGGYLDGDKILLKYKDEVISEYPEPVPGAPHLIRRKKISMWGSLKKK